MDDEREERDQPYELTADERRDIQADLDDLSSMRSAFSSQGVKGVVIACQECGANHFYEWELLRDNLEHMLQSGEPRMHEPAFDIVEEEYIQWDYGKGYVDALADTGLEPARRIELTSCPWCQVAVRRGPCLLSSMRSLDGRRPALPRTDREGDGRPGREGAARASRLRAVLSREVRFQRFFRT